MHRGSGFSLDHRRADQGANLQSFYHGGHRVLMRRKQWENFRVLWWVLWKTDWWLVVVVIVNPKWWWLWIDLDSLVVVGLLLVWVDWFVCVWSLFGQLGSLMILAWVDWIGFSLRFVVDLMVLGNWFALNLGFPWGLMISMKFDEFGRLGYVDGAGWLWWIWVDLGLMIGLSSLFFILPVSI